MMLTDTSGNIAGGTEHIVLVTRDDNFSRMIEKQFTANGYKVSVFQSAASCLAAVRCKPPSLILVDRQLKSDQFRREPNLQGVPLIALQPPGQSCKEEECLQDLEQDFDVVLCNVGYRELIARVRAVLRREHLGIISKSRFEVGGLALDVDCHEVTVDGHLVDPTPTEFRILHHFMLHPSRVFSRDELFDQIWGKDRALEDHTLDVHIHTLRQKIEPDPAHPRFIVTVRGYGYKLKGDSSPSEQFCKVSTARPKPTATPGIA
jgi:two-component system response regulator RegX3